MAKQRALFQGLSDWESDDEFIDYDEFINDDDDDLKIQFRLKQLKKRAKGVPV